jgi:hypothetical protein
MRIQIDWGGVQPSPGGPYNWAGADAAIGAAAQASLDVLPSLAGAPRWAVKPGAVPGTHGRTKAPRHLPARGRAGRGWSAFVHAAVARYGPRGSFWAEHPEVSPRPVHAWQVWNEENFKYFVVRPNPAEYGRLVKSSARAIRSADRRATIVLGGLFARPAEGAWRRRPRQAYFATDFLDLMYRRVGGIRSKFDAVALHPYTADFRRLAPEIEKVRRVLRRHRDGRKQLWITELGWSSQRPSRGNSFAKGVRGQARQLKGAFRVLSHNQRRWNLRRVYWFSVDDRAGVCNFCGGTGLFRRGFRPKPAWLAFTHFARRR